MLHESLGLRVARATNHLRATLMAGFTTIRDLGTEGRGLRGRRAQAGGRRRASFPGRACSSTTRAIVATGSYGPKGFALEWRVPQGAEEADGADSSSASSATRSATAPTGSRSTPTTAGGRAARRAPTFSDRGDEADRRDRAQQRPARSSRTRARAEGMRRAMLAGVETIEHGDGGTPEVFKLMEERNVALCPTLAAGDATSQYAGWKKGEARSPPASRASARASRRALDAGVTILNGSDVGVFAHGDNARELELMVSYGMTRGRTR